MRLKAAIRSLLNRALLLKNAGCCADTVAAHEYRPSAGRLETVRARLVHHLDSEVVPFWVSATVNDVRFDGWVPVLNGRLQPTGQTQRAAIVQLRLLYVFAVAIARCPNPSGEQELRKQFQCRFDFFVDQFLDCEAGGFYNTICESGQPDKGPKETRVQIHALNFLSQIHCLTGNVQSLQLATETWRIIAAKGIDKEYGGCNRFFELPPEDPQNNRKLLSDQIHLALALMHLNQADPKPDHVAMLQKMVDLLLCRFEIPALSGNVINELSRCWQKLPLVDVQQTGIDFGHLAELIWYVLESTKALNRPVDEIQPWLIRLSESLLRLGISRHGAVYRFGTSEGRPTDLKSFWWAQAEAMVALLRTFEVTGDIRYWRAFEAVRVWTFRNMVTGPSGTWQAIRDPLGFSSSTDRVGRHWQCGFHVTRCLLKCEASLTRLLSNQNGRPADG